MTAWLSIAATAVLFVTSLLGWLAAPQTAPQKQFQNASTVTIMFESRTDQSRPGSDAIYSVNSDGTNLRRLTADGDHILRGPPFPQWSLDGQHIAYVNWIEGLDIGLVGFVAGELYVIDREGADRHLLVHVSQIRGQPTQQISGVAWSPDGKTLAVTRLGSGVFLLSPNGQAQPRLVLRSEARNYSSPVWSPDGKRIALYAYERDGNSQMSDVHVINSDGSNDIQVAPSVIQTRVQQRDIPISWSRDSKTVYFAMLQSSDQPSAIWTVQGASVDGSKVTQLTDTALNARSPLASPDGTRISFTGPQSGLRSDIFVMNQDGSSRRGVTSDPDWACTNSAWSSDGKELVLSCNFIRDPSDWRMFLITPDNPPLKLTPIIDRDAFNPSIAPSPY